MFANLSKSRRQLIGIIGLFLLPPLSAWIAWAYLDTYGVSSTYNTGTLIQPARPLPRMGLLVNQSQTPYDFAELRGRWFYVIYAGSACTKQCQDQLYITRQIRIGVNKDTQRIRRLLVTEQPLAASLQTSIAKEHPDLIVVQAASGTEGLAWQQPFQEAGFDTSGTAYFLVDPLGNLMMMYDDSMLPKGILRDLQKLLKISQIG
jgi:cytochrome oxidase Cu insertion factor (SCO1/SenC/PrrC family)